MSFRKDKIKTAIFSKPYYKYFIMIFFSYAIFNIYINELHVTGSAIFHFRTYYVILFLLFNLIVALLVALSMNLVIMRFKEMKQLKSGKKAGGMAAAGMFAGLIGGACPGCFAGIFPAVLGLFGSTGTLGILPFNGLEIQVGTIAIILFSIYMLTKPMTCKVKIPKTTH